MITANNTGNITALCALTKALLSGRYNNPEKNQRTETRDFSQHKIYQAFLRIKRQIEQETG